MWHDWPPGNEEPNHMSKQPSLSRSRQSAMYRRALQAMPGGTDSNFRTWGEDTIYVDRGEGGRVWDIDGNEYIDLRMGYGPVILGHGDARVDDYVNERMRRGVSFSLTSEDEVEAMELLKELTGWVGKARMTVSGTEATMHAMRIARAYTGRTKIVKFEGQYHGVHDYALISVTPNDMSDLGSEDNPVGLAWGRGIPEAITKTVIPARYNEMAVLRRIFERDGADIAAIIVEPVLGNAQAIMPRAGFHEEMRALTREFGALLIFDEVKTGFRFARGGAAEFFGVTPDLATFAKAMGNGYPAAAFGGSDEVMSVLPDKVSHGGTYAGNPLADAEVDRGPVVPVAVLSDLEAAANAIGGVHFDRYSTHVAQYHQARGFPATPLLLGSYAAVVVDQFDTETRMSRIPCHVVAPIQHSPLRCTASITRSVVASQSAAEPVPNRTSTWLSTTSFTTSTPSAARS